MKSMQGWYAVRIVGMALALGAVGCAPDGVGDPCIPEAIPCGPDPNNPSGPEICGFDESESYIEASSVQCRSRLCVVNKLSGDPTQICQPDGPSTAANCVRAQDLDERVYCSCRCNVPDDVQGSFPECDCPSGFSCEDILALGADGIRGGYCVKDIQSSDL